MLKNSHRIKANYTEHAREKEKYKKKRKKNSTLVRQNMDADNTPLREVATLLISIAIITFLFFFIYYFFVFFRKNALRTNSFNAICGCTRYPLQYKCQSLPQKTYYDVNGPNNYTMPYELESASVNVILKLSRDFT